jgi:peptidyl-prolyl cis-trans isomerase SurA
MKKMLWITVLILIMSAPAPARIVDRILAQVNDDIITLSDLNREMASVRQELSTKYTGQQLEDEIKRAEKAVLEELIRQKLLLQKGNELGFGANVDSQVSAQLERIRKENKFKDMQELERAAAQQGLTLPQLRDSIKKQIISQSVVQEFVGARITVLTQEIDKYYRDHKDDYSIPEEVSLSEILIPVEGNPAEAESRANEIRNRITAGEAFATLASQYSKGPTAGKGGSIGTYITKKLNPEIANAIANVKEGDSTPVLRTKEGFILYRVDTRKAAAYKPLEEIREEIKNRIYQQKFNPEFERFSSQLKEDAYIQIFGEIAAK